MIWEIRPNGRWGDVNEYGRVMKTVEQRVESLKELHNAHRRTIRDVERMMFRGKLSVFARCPCE